MILHCGRYFKKHKKVKTTFSSYKKANKCISIQHNEPNNPLFIKLNTLKFYKPVELKLAQLMFKEHNNLLCHSTAETVLNSTVLRCTGLDKKKKSKSRTNMKQRCVSAIGANLWNNFGTDLRKASIACCFQKRVQK